jgi:hypothetical protein
MNIEQAKAIPIAYILEKLNLKPTKQTTNEAWYLSPLRNEKTASFKINNKRNVWYDFGEGRGGDSVSFVCAYLESNKENHLVPDALRWLKNMSGIMPVIKNVLTENYTKEDSKLVLKSAKKIAHPALIHYMENRGIPLTVGEECLKEVKVFNNETKKTIFALGLSNEEGGFELRNSFFKGCVGKKSITFIRGLKVKPGGIHFFEGFMDYLSVIANSNGAKLPDDAIILNSLSNLKKATAYIQNYGYTTAYTWMDNDIAGAKATQSLDDYFRSQKTIEHIKMNIMYAPEKDVNAYHVKKLGL